MHKNRSVTSFFASPASRRQRFASPRPRLLTDSSRLSSDVTGDLSSPYLTSKLISCGIYQHRNMIAGYIRKIYQSPHSFNRMPTFITSKPIYGFVYCLLSLIDCSILRTVYSKTLIKLSCSSLVAHLPLTLTFTRFSNISCHDDNNLYVVASKWIIV